ncbi:MAG: NirA family protein [Pseudomonadota bacterium]
MSDNPTFTPEQKEYLEGFMTGANKARQALGMPPLAALANGGAAVPGVDNGTSPSGPDAVHAAAQDRFLADGKKLTAEEKAKRDGHPFDMWDEIVAKTQAGEFPKGTDVFKYKYYGLFFTGPNQKAFMSRLKLPNGILNAWQFRGLADLAERYGGGYAHVTTRANLQIREIGAIDAVPYLEGLFALGITSKGSGADNIRNITGSPTAGIDAEELIDTRPLAREIQHYILNRRDFFGLPRKFNIAFDGGGRIGVLEESNDIGFTAFRVGEGRAVPPGIYFRLALGGITGHKDIAQDAGVVLRPEECTPVAAAIIRVFIDEGDRTDRTKARMKYVLDRWGHETYLAEVEKVLGYTLPRLPLEEGELRGGIDRMAHVGVHEQVQEDRFYIGVALPVGRLAPEQMHALADLAQRYGDGDIRLTVWQNLLLSGIAGDDVEDVKKRIEAMGLAWSASNLRAGLVACTGAFGCRFALAYTKENATKIIEHIDTRLVLDQPINIHITGCHHSCAQHYIGDIGLLSTKVDLGGEDVDDGEEVEGFHIVVGGGWGEKAAIGRELYESITAERAPEVIERMLSVYLERREAEETFADFANRHELDELKQHFAIEA